MAFPHCSSFRPLGWYALSPPPLGTPPLLVPPHPYAHRELSRGSFSLPLPATARFVSKFHDTFASPPFPTPLPPVFSLGDHLRPFFDLLLMVSCPTAQTTPYLRARLLLVVLNCRNVCEPCFPLLPFFPSERTSFPFSCHLGPSHSVRDLGLLPFPTLSFTTQSPMVLSRTAGFPPFSHLCKRF